jgi:DNA-binding NarL/FixJ family response regulator
MEVAGVSWRSCCVPAIVAAHDIDCVLLDLRMPGGMDGIEVLRRIRERDHSLPVIMGQGFSGRASGRRRGPELCDLEGRFASRISGTTLPGVER